MTDTELFILAAGGYLFLTRGSSQAPAVAMVAGPDRVDATTTTKVVDNKATNTGSTVVELANDLKVVATDGVDIFKSVSTAFSTNSDDGDDTIYE